MADSASNNQGYALTPAVGGPAARGLAAGRLQSFTGGGDSFTAHLQQAFIPSVQTALNGLIYLTIAGHGLATGDVLNATGSALETANVVYTSLTRIDSSNISFPAPGTPDGPIIAGAATYQVTVWSQQTAEGWFTHLSRQMGGGITLVAQAGMSGYQMAAYAARYNTALAPYPSDAHIHWGYFNDLQFGVTVAASTAIVQSTLLRRKAQGSLVACVSAMPIPLGVYTWPTLTAPLVTLTDASAAQWVVQWNAMMRAFCAANGMLWLDVHGLAVDPTTGYALVGWNKNNDVHPSQKSNYTVAKLFKAQITQYQYQPALLTASIFDNSSAAGGSANRNVAQAAPFVQGGGGSGGATTVYTPWVTATVVPGVRWRTNAGHLYFTIAGGTTGATAPTHTAGAASDGAVVWQYMGEAIGTAGIPASWGVFASGNANCACLAALVPDGNGGQLLRVFANGAASGDQIRISLTGIPSTVSFGDLMNAKALVSLSTAANTTAATVPVSGLANTNQTAPTPAAQNVKVFELQVVQSIVDATGTTLTYTALEGRNGVAIAAEQQTDDIFQQVASVNNVLVYPGTVGNPSTALALLRPDLLLQFLGQSTCYVDVGRLTVLH